MYYCQICNYKTKERSKIQSHHIVPRSTGGSNKKWNLVYLCANCHNLIFYPSENINNNGAHSIQTDDSIIIHGWLMSSCGRLLHYTRYNEEFFVENKNK